MRFLGLCLMGFTAVAVTGGVGCKKSPSQSAEQAPPPAEPSAAAAQPSTPAPPPTPPPAEPSVRIVETAPAVAATPPPAAATPAVAPAAGGLRGAPEVRAALKRKDYIGAVMTLQGVKTSIKVEQRPEYNGLLFEVKQAIVEDMAKNASAKQAWNTLRLMEAGR